MADELEWGKRADHLTSTLKNHQLVLSNPDIFHAIMQFAYQQGRAPDYIAGQLAQLFDQLTFDEFHIFDVPQIAAVLTGLLFLYEQKGKYPLKTLFLSATPSDTLAPLLEKAGFKDRLRIVKGTYCYASAPDPKEWRPILRPATLHLASQPIEEWLDAHFEDVLLAFFKQHGKGAKGAIIVNSVATAQRLFERLRVLLVPYGLEVLPNTGITLRSLRRDSYAADILIGTSTIDIGVDFQINFLLFEANDAGTFLQRLGRLGRHDSYTAKDGASLSFTSFEAHALLPNFVVNRLSVSYQGGPALLTAGQPLRRDELQEAVRQAFPQPARYDHYLPIWGRFQPMHVLRNLSHPTIKASYKDLTGRLKARYEQVFQTSMKKAIYDAVEMTNGRKDALLKEARSFRGGSSFDCGVLLAGEDEPLTYNLLWLLVNAELELLTRDTFCKELQRSGQSYAPFTRDYHVAFFRLLGWRAQRESLQVDLNRAREIDWASERSGYAQVVSGVRFDCAGVPCLNQINRNLANRRVVALVYPGIQPVDMRFQTYVPGIFPLYEYEGNGKHGTIAFGRYALILDTMLRYKTLRGAPNDPFML
jgi:CRISPR-associated endonuclease/helicase Cas3